VKLTSECLYASLVASSNASVASVTASNVSSTDTPTVRTLFIVHMVPSSEGMMSTESSAAELQEVAKRPAFNALPNPPAALQIT